MDPSQNEAEALQNPNPNLTNLSTNFSYSVSSDPTQPTTIDPRGAMYLNYPPPPLPPGTVPNTQNPVCYEPQQEASATAYQDPIAAAYYQKLNENWLAAITQLGGISHAAGATTTVPAIQIQKKITKHKGLKKATIAQSSWCDVCKICCNSEDILDQHKLGKKHQRNVKKLQPQFSDVPLPVSTSAPTNGPLIGPEEKPKLPISQKTPEDLETKRRKVLDGGAPAATVRVCHLCNVVCNSDTVFGHHLTGQKHLSMVKKLAPGDNC